MTGLTNGTCCGEIKKIAASNNGSDFQAKIDTCAGLGGRSSYFQGARPTELVLAVTIRTR